MARRLLLLGAVLLAAFLLVTYWALESSEVARITTYPAGGEPRTTHVWVAELDGDPWLEAGTPENAWYRDVLEDPRLRLEFEGAAAREFRAQTVPGRSGDVRAALRARYGWRDRWVGMFVDASRSLAVRLDPAP